MVGAGPDVPHAVLSQESVKFLRTKLGAIVANSSIWQTETTKRSLSVMFWTTVRDSYVARPRTNGKRARIRRTLALRTGRP